jgi:hypothetical protein
LVLVGRTNILIPFHWLIILGFQPFLVSIETQISCRWLMIEVSVYFWATKSIKELHEHL